MQTTEIIKEIEDYFNNTLFILPSISSTGHITISQPEKQIRLDITNEVDSENKDIRVFQLESIEQAYEVLGGITRGNRSQCKTTVDSFVQEQGVDVTKDLYLTAYLMGKE